MKQTGGKVYKHAWVCKYTIIRLNLVQRLNIPDIIDEDNNIYFNLFTIYNLQLNANWSFEVGGGGGGQLVRALIAKTISTSWIFC